MYYGPTLLPNCHEAVNVLDGSIEFGDRTWPRSCTQLNVFSGLTVLSKYMDKTIPQEQTKQNQKRRTSINVCPVFRNVKSS